MIQKTYLENLEGNADTCCTIDSIDPEQHGYVKVNKESFESGWRTNQTDDPHTIAKDLEEKGIARYLFVLDESSQFFSRFSVFVHEDEKELLKNY